MPSLNEQEVWAYWQSLAPAHRPPDWAVHQALRDFRVFVKAGVEEAVIAMARLREQLSQQAPKAVLQRTPIPTATQKVMPLETLCQEVMAMVREECLGTSVAPCRTNNVSAFMTGLSAGTTLSQTFNDLASYFGTTISAVTTAFLTGNSLPVSDVEHRTPTYSVSMPKGGTLKLALHGAVPLTGDIRVSRWTGLLPAVRQWFHQPRQQVQNGKDSALLAFITERATAEGWHEGHAPDRFWQRSLSEWNATYPQWKIPTAEAVRKRYNRAKKRDEGKRRQVSQWLRPDAPI